MKKLRLLLWPFSLVYGAIMAARNWAFNAGWLKSQAYPTPVIAVGNLSTGGTGKTPFTEFILSQLSPFKAAVVSRGYGRKSKGCLKVNTNGTPAQFGDEPLQIARNFKPTPVYVAEKRTEGIAEAIQESAGLQYLLLDDAYQHRHVKAGFYVLLSTFQNPFYTDFVLPAGNLRESRQGAQRAQAIVITKCPPNLSAKSQEEIKRQVKRYSPAPVYFSYIQYGAPTNPYGDVLGPAPADLITGIANPQPLVDYLKTQGQLGTHHRFNDHHNFSTTEIKGFMALLIAQGKNLITTQKDWVRLAPLLPEDLHKQCFTVPITLGLLAAQKEVFLKQLHNYINAAAN